MEYFPHGDLQQFAGYTVPETEMQAIGSQVLEGLYFMHSQGYAHRDLKPQVHISVPSSPVSMG